MPDIKLSDGKKIPFSKKIDGFEIAKKISKSLYKEACVMSVDGQLKDLSFSISKDSEFKNAVDGLLNRGVFTLAHKRAKEALRLIRKANEKATESNKSIKEPRYMT